MIRASSVVAGVIALTLGFESRLFAGTGIPPLTTVRVASGLTRPLFVASPPGDYDRLFIVEQTGRIKILDLNTLTILGTPYANFSTLITTAGNEQGLLGLAFDPNFATNAFFYVNYTNTAGDTVVARYRATGSNPASNTADMTSATLLLGIDQPFSNHNGGWIGFSPNDGFLYVAMGDGGSGNDPNGNGQNLNTMLGKMLRIRGDGTIPSTNPFFGAIPGLDHIWAYGLRNPWRCSFDSVTGDLYIGDVGQGAWEEIDFQPAASPGGENYGWRCMEGNHCTGLTGCTCFAGSLEIPIHEYSHSVGFSITGGYVYHGCQIPELDGTYFFADYVNSIIWSFTYDGAVMTNFVNRTAELDPPGAQSITTPSSFGVDAHGEIYICDHGGGEVFKIIPASGPTIDCNGNGQQDVCDIEDGTSLDVDMDGVPDECVPSCPSTNSCADLNKDNIRDDNCKWWDCSTDCMSTDIIFGDMGGIGDDCAPDGAADANDGYQALRCFADVNVSNMPPYPCEKINVDAAGPNLGCCADGSCDANDVYAALNAFGNTSSCTCPLQSGTQSCAPSAAVFDEPRFVARAALSLVAEPRVAHRGDLVTVDVYIDNRLGDLRGYQLHLAAGGGRRGRLDLVEAGVHDRPDAAFTGLGALAAANTHTEQMFVGLAGDGIETRGRTYLASYTYRVSNDAAGAFVVDVLGFRPETPERRTFLFASNSGMISLTHTSPTVITIVNEQMRGLR